MWNWTDENLFECGTDSHFSKVCSRYDLSKGSWNTRLKLAHMDNIWCLVVCSRKEKKQNKNIYKCQKKEKLFERDEKVVGAFKAVICNCVYFEPMNLMWTHLEQHFLWDTFIFVFDTKCKLETTLLPILAVRSTIYNRNTMLILLKLMFYWC